MNLVQTVIAIPEVRLQLAAVVLAEEMNFTRAAERINITQPVLSKQIAELERRLGFLVFKRNQKRVELTEAGQVFIRRLQRWDVGAGEGCEIGSHHSRRNSTRSNDRAQSIR